MAITLTTFEDGMTDYRPRMNSDNTTIANAINALQALNAAGTASLLSNIGLYNALFGPGIARIDPGALGTSYAGTEVTVGPGAVYLPIDSTVRTLLTEGTIDFAGQGADTYYITINADGSLGYNDTGINAISVVEWNGSAITSLTDITATAAGFGEFTGARYSDALAQTTYESIGARLEAGDGASVKVLDVAVSGSDITLSTADGMHHAALLLVGTQTADIDLIVPAFQKPWYIINQLSGGFDVTVKTSVGTGVVFTDGTSGAVVSDGTDVFSVGAVQGGAAGPEPYKVSLSRNGLMEDDGVMLILPMDTTVTFPAGLTGSQAVLLTAATAQTDVSVIRQDGDGSNSSVVGTIRFAAAGKIATFIMATETVYTAGQVMLIKSQATADTTAAGFGMTLAGTR